MSYLVLARKWRPQTFEEVVGQQPVIRTLQNAIERNRIPHAIIFSGVRGVGKTTLARLVAKALNCQEGPTKAPCNSCAHCTEITAGSAIDLHEIDGASNRGIQEIRELKENIRFFPTRSRYKVIIIDEVHMLTTEAFNALLKTLEEPPAHVIFMFATTELHKIPITILSRCQRYELQKVSSRDLFAFFAKIAREEKIRISEWALNIIVREAGGSVRDGLSLLDQIFSFGGEEITDEDVTEVLGLVDSQVISSMAEAVLNGDLGAGLRILEETSAFGVDLKRLANDLLYYFRSLLICRVSGAPQKLLDLPDVELEELLRIGADHTVETLQLYFNMLLKGVEAMQYSSHPRLAFEMALIRAAEAGNVVPVTELLDKLVTLQPGTVAVPPAAAAAHVEKAPPPAAAKRKKAEPQPKRAASAGPEKTTQQEKETVAETPSPPVKQREERGAPNTVPQPAAAKVVADNLPPPSGQEVRRNWDGFIDYVMDRKKWMAHTLRLSSGVREEGSDLILKFDDPSDCKVLQSKENMKFLTEFSQDFFQKEFKVRIKIRGGDLHESVGENGTGPQEERRALANDPLVQMATEILGGRVIHIRTGPRSR
ncbi:MAG: DNA polymerase III subunit gamma/tau [Deltaproteobacteria bacterium]|jgi:DNA polymerase-3 subunit gamma/tau|nr:DNA polymerase III subunit gamma/tau [Deltaproteobacteria bacterium]